mmetsp:Transcript_13275/g.28688  ORF Transcript_13275/g.28688 Transcript_13275/m.28688 type:complete len:228 (+) Transcript_13275:168-851(+)
MREADPSAGVAREEADSVAGRQSHSPHQEQGGGGTGGGRTARDGEGGAGEGEGGTAARAAKLVDGEGRAGGAAGGSREHTARDQATVRPAEGQALGRCEGRSREGSPRTRPGSHHARGRRRRGRRRVRRRGERRTGTTSPPIGDARPPPKDGAGEPSTTEANRSEVGRPRRRDAEGGEERRFVVAGTEEATSAEALPIRGRRPDVAGRRSRVPAKGGGGGEKVVACR